jgi:hypothetical protein
MRMRGSKVTDLKYRSVLENAAGLQERKAWILRKVCFYRSPLGLLGLQIDDGTAFFS